MIERIVDLKRVLLSTKGELNKQRKEDIEKVIDYYTDRHKPYLKELLNEHFIDYKNGDLKILLKTVPLTKYVIDAVSLVFNGKHYYDLLDGTESDKEIWNQINESLKWDLKSFNSTLNSYVNLTGSPAVKVSWRNDSIQLDIITPDLYDIIQNPIDITDADAVTYSRERTDTVSDTSDITNYIWTKTEHFAFDENGREIEMEGNQNGINPYKIIPIVFVRNGIPVGQFWIEPELSLAEANENINFHLCELNHLIKFQSFSIPVLVGTKEAVNKIKIGAGAAVRIPFGNPDDPSPNLTFASPNARIVELLNLIQADITQICTFYGIDASNFVLTSGAASGISIELKQKALANIVIDTRPIYEKYVSELFTVIKTIWNYHSKSKKFSDKCRLKLNFVDSNITNLRDQIEVDDFDLKYDLTSKVHILMNRGMTETEAIAYLEQVAEYNKKFPVTTID